MKQRQLISLPSAIFVLFCFFVLPWISVSCSGQEVASFTGMDLAAGKVINVGFGTQPERVGGDAAMYAIPAVAVIAAVLALAGISSSSKGSATGQLLMGGIGFAIMGLKWMAMNNEMSSAASGAGVAMSMFDVSIEFGVWGTLLGLAGIVIGATVGLGETARDPTDIWDDDFNTWQDDWKSDSSF